MISFTLDPALIIQLLVSTVLPLLVGLVTKTITHGGVKAVLLAGLALVTSLLTELGQAIANAVPYDLGQGLLLAIPIFLIAVGLHYGLWRPTGVSEKLQSVGSSETPQSDLVSYALATDTAVERAAEAAVTNALRRRDLRDS